MFSWNIRAQSFYLSRLSLTLGTRIVPHLSHGDGVSVRHSMRCHKRPVFFPCVINLASPTYVRLPNRVLDILVEFTRCFQGAVMPTQSRVGISIYAATHAPLICRVRDQLHGTSYNLSINTHHKVCNNYAISGSRETIPHFTLLLRKAILCVSNSVNRRQWT